MKASGDLHGGYYSDAIIAQFTGKGTGQCYNPTKILQAFGNSCVGRPVGR